MKQDKNEVHVDVKRIMAEIFRLEPSLIRDDATIENQQAWESINHINLILALEEEFKIRFSDTEATEMVSISRLVACIFEKLSNREQVAPPSDPTGFDTEPS